MLTIWMYKQNNALSVKFQQLLIFFDQGRVYFLLWKGCCDHEIALKVDIAREREILLVICLITYWWAAKIEAEVSNGSMIAMNCIIESRISLILELKNHF